MRINDVQKLCRSASAILNYLKGIGARRHERARQHTCHDGDRGQQEQGGGVQWQSSGSGGTAQPAGLFIAPARYAMHSTPPPIGPAGGGGQIAPRTVHAMTKSAMQRSHINEAEREQCPNTAERWS